MARGYDDILIVFADTPLIRPESLSAMRGAIAAGASVAAIARAYAIAREHGGSLRHEPAPGGGARFIVRLPIAGQPPLGAVPHGNGKHTDRMHQRGLHAPMHKPGEQCFGIGVSQPWAGMAAGSLYFGAQPQVVVNFTIKNNCYRSIFVRYRLVATR
mgnify:CR=1 FL=1